MNSVTITGTVDDEVVVLSRRPKKIVEFHLRLDVNEDPALVTVRASAYRGAVLHTSKVKPGAEVAIIGTLFADHTGQVVIIADKVFASAMEPVLHPPRPDLDGQIDDQADEPTAPLEFAVPQERRPRWRLGVR